MYIMAIKVESIYCGGFCEKFFATEEEAVAAIREFGAQHCPGEEWPWVATDVDKYGNEIAFRLVPLC